MQRLRSVGRILALALGALAGIGLVQATPPAAVYSLAAIAAVAAAAGTHRSRWYVTSAFTTFLVFLLLLYSNPQEAASRFTERLLETLLGVGLAMSSVSGCQRLRSKAENASTRTDRADAIDHAKGGACRPWISPSPTKLVSISRN